MFHDRIGTVILHLVHSTVDHYCAIVYHCRGLRFCAMGGGWRRLRDREEWDVYITSLTNNTLRLVVNMLENVLNMRYIVYITT